MNELKIFENSEFGRIRAVEQNGEPWFVAKDLAEILGYTTLQRMYDHVQKRDKQNIDPQSQCFQGLCENGTALEPNPNIRRMTIINESGLYDAIFGSTLPQAKEFRHWVTSEVLPSMRKHGAYMTPDTLDRMISSPEFGIKLLTALKEEQEARKALEEQAEKDKPKVIFADAVAASKTSILVGDLAKLLKQNGIDIGQKRLFQWMRDNGYLIKQKGNSYNMPTQRSMESGLFEIKETTVTHADGHISINRTPKITGKGQVFFVKKFLRGEQNEG